MTHVGEIAAQLTAINSHHAQFGVAWTSTPGDIAQIATNMDKSQSASTKMSSATNPHDRPLNLATSTGVKGWTAGVTLPAHIPTDIKVGPEAKEKFRTLLEHLDVCGFGKILRIATTGTGVAGPSPISHTGSPDSADHQLGDWTSLTTNYVNLTREHILKMSGWIHGDIDDGLTVPTNLVQKTLDFQSTGKNGNSKLVAEMKQQFRIKADQLMHIWRNHINHTSLEAFLAQKDIYVWEKESDGTTFYCGLTILWLILETIEPQTVVDAQEYEDFIEKLSLVTDCNGDIRQYISKLQTARNELTVRHGKDRMTDDKFLKFLFDGLRVVAQPTFKNLVDQTKSLWMQGELQGNQDVTDFLRKIDKLYTSQLTSKEWSVQAEPDPKMVALTTENKTLQNKVRKLEQNQASHVPKGGKGSGKDNTIYTNEKGIEVAGPPGTRDHRIALWRTIKTKSCITRTLGTDQVKFFWCDKHRQGKGLYMRENASNPDRHDHEKWREELAQKNEEDAKKRRGKKTKQKRARSDVSSVNSSASDQPRLVVKTQKSVNTLVTKHGLSHEQALRIALDPRVNGESDSDSDDSDSSGN